MKTQYVIYDWKQKTYLDVLFNTAHKAEKVSSKWNSLKKSPGENSICSRFSVVDFKSVKDSSPASLPGEGKFSFGGNHE